MHDEGVTGMEKEWIGCEARRAPKIENEVCTECAEQTGSNNVAGRHPDGSSTASTKTMTAPWNEKSSPEDRPGLIGSIGTKTAKSILMTQRVLRPIAKADVLAANSRQRRSPSPNPSAAFVWPVCK